MTREKHMRMSNEYLRSSDEINNNDVNAQNDDQFEIDSFKQRLPLCYENLVSFYYGINDQNWLTL